MSHQIKLTEAKAITTAVIRSQVPVQELARFVPAACGEVWQFIRSAGLRQPGRHVTLYLDGGFVEVGAEVSEPFAGNERIRCSELPAGRTVTTVHFGPYQHLKRAHDAIHEWCIRHGHQCSGTSWEIYGHWEESWNMDASKIRTDVFHLLRDSKE
jgi:effector-binding domain-containing protein